MASNSQNSENSVGTGVVNFFPVIIGLEENIRDQVEKGFGDVDIPTEPIEEEMGGAGERAGNNFGNAMGAAVAALGLGAVLSDQIANSMQFEGLNNQLSAALALTPEQEAAVTSASEDLFANAYGQSYESVSESMRQIVGSVEGAREMTADELEAMGADMINLSETFGLSNEEIARAAQSAIGGGLVDTWDEAMSLILAGQQEFGASGEDWLDSINEFSDDFATLGFSAAESVQLVDAALTAGIRDTDALADSLNEVQIRLGDMSSWDAISALGLDPATVRDTIAAGGDEAQAAILDLMGRLQATGDRDMWAQVFGTRAEDYFQAFQNMDLSTINGDLGEMVGNLEAFDTTLNEGAAVSMETFKRLVDEAFNMILTPALQVASPILSGFVGFLKENEWAMAAFTTIVGGVFLVALYAATAALWGMVAPMVAVSWPVLAVIAVIALLVAGIWWLVENWDSVTQFMSDAWSGFAGFMTDTWNGAMGWITDTWNGFTGMIQDAGTNIGNFFQDTGTNIANFFIGAGNMVIDMLNTITDGLNSLSTFQLPDWLGGASFGGFGIGQISNIPALASGGTILPSTGGTIARLAEAGKPETVVDTGLHNKVMERVLAQPAGGGNTTYQIYQQPGEPTSELVERIEAYKEQNRTREGYAYAG